MSQPAEGLQSRPLAHISLSACSSLATHAPRRAGCVSPAGRSAEAGVQDGRPVAGSDAACSLTVRVKCGLRSRAGNPAETSHLSQQTCSASGQNVSPLCAAQQLSWQDCKWLPGRADTLGCVALMPHKTIIAFWATLLACAGQMLLDMFKAALHLASYICTRWCHEQKAHTCPAHPGHPMLHILLP